MIGLCSDNMITDDPFEIGLPIPTLFHLQQKDDKRKQPICSARILFCVRNEPASRPRFSLSGAAAGSDLIYIYPQHYAYFMCILFIVDILDMIYFRIHTDNNVDYLNTIYLLFDIIFRIVYISCISYDISTKHNLHVLICS